MIFSSKTPRDLNRDPRPYRHDRHEARGKHYIPGQEQYGWVHDPRPEFDHVQHNEPNPILVDLRSIYEECHQPLGITVAELASDWLDILEEDPAMIQPRNWGLLAEAVTGDQIDHARLVLTRLAQIGDAS